MPHPYECYKEITDQTHAWAESINSVLTMENELKAFWDKQRPTQVIFTGCTSPYFAGMSAAMFWQATLGVPAIAVPCNDLIQFPSSYINKKGRPILVVLSRSGRTTEAIWAVDEFSKKYPRSTILISPRTNTPLSRLTTINLIFPTGDDSAIPQTRSLSSMYLASLTLGALIANKQNEIDLLKSTYLSVAPIVNTVETTIREVIESRVFTKVFFLGAGPLYGIAREATLKMMEMSLMDAYAYQFLEARHGPRSLLDPKTLVVGLYSRSGLKYEAQVMEEFTQNIGVASLALIPNTSWGTGIVTYSVATGHDWGDYFQGLAYLPVLQLLAYYNSIKRDMNPDSSRNTSAFIEISRL